MKSPFLVILSLSLTLAHSVSLGHPYLGWAASFPTLTNTDPNYDFDNDGLATGLEWVLDGDPTGSDSGALAPTSSVDENELVFVFSRNDRANGPIDYTGPGGIPDGVPDPNTWIFVKYGTDLVNWNSAKDGANGVEIAEDDDFFGEGIDRVTVRIPRSLAVGGKLFARLNVQIQGV